MMPEEQPSSEVGQVEEVQTATVGRTPVWGWRDVMLFVGLSLPIIALLQFALAIIAKLLHHPPGDLVLGVVGQGIAYPLIFAMLAGILRTQYDAPFWPSIGWVPSRIPIVLSLVSGVVIAYSVGILGWLLRIPDVDSPVNKLLESRDSAVILVVFGVLVAPLAEELAFRGFLQPLLIRSLGVIGGIAATALLFGMLHWEQNSRSWEYVGIISLAGAGFGVLRHISGSTRTSTLAHVAYNSTLFLAYFAQERKSSI